MSHLIHDIPCSSKIKSINRILKGVTYWISLAARMSKIACSTWGTIFCVAVYAASKGDLFVESISHVTNGPWNQSGIWAVNPIQCTFKIYTATSWIIHAWLHLFCKKTLVYLETQIHHCVAYTVITAGPTFCHNGTGMSKYSVSKLKPSWGAFVDKAPTSEWCTGGYNKGLYISFIFAAVDISIQFQRAVTQDICLFTIKMLEKHTWRVTAVFPFYSSLHVFLEKAHVYI